MSIQKDLERLINEAIDAMDIVRDKLKQIIELNPEIEIYPSVFVNANECLNDIYSTIEDLDA